MRRTGPDPRTLTLGGAALLACAAVAVLLVLGLARSPDARRSRVAPALPRERLSGPPATLASLLAGAGGRPALVVFWASWCGPCRQEAPALERFYRSPAGARRLVGVDWSDPDTGEARAFVRRYGWTFPVLRDGEGAVGNEYGVSSLPNTFVIGARGRIGAVLRGPQTVATLDAALARAERA